MDTPVDTAAGRRGTAAGAAPEVTRTLARHAAALKYDALPPALVEVIKQCVLDTLGVSAGASTLAPEAAILAEYVRDLGGKPEATLLGFGGKAPAPSAALLNGSLGHMLDYDDLGESGHPAIVTIPVALAIAEKQGGASGRELITAVAAGMDVMTRLTQAIDVPDWTMTEGWFATQLFGFIAGAVTAGRLLGLDEERMENAIGIGFNQMSGTRQMAAGAATHMRSMQAGFSGQGAVLAAELARRGIIGSKAVVEGRYGIFKTYIRGTEPDWNAIVDGLGLRFPLVEKHGFKVWPACGYTRTTNTSTLYLREKHGLRPDDIESITIVGGTGGTQQLCEPLEKKRRPQTSIDGKFSIPFTTAVMMAKGNVTLRDYTAAGLADAAVLAMADRITYRAGTEAITGKGGSSDVSRTAVEIVTKDGRRFEHRPTTGVPGDPKNPVSWAALEAKFRDCVSFSAQPVSAANADRAIASVRDLENAADATEVVRQLS